jgi:hypothetical protein
MTRDEFIAECDEFDAARMRKEEWEHIDRQLNAMHKRQFEGDSSELTRQKINRLEAVQACLCGSPEALGQEPPGPRHRA